MVLLCYVFFNLMYQNAKEICGTKWVRASAVISSLLIPLGRGCNIPCDSLNPSVLCCAWSLRCRRLFVTPWTVAHQASLSMGILQARIMEWVVMPSSRGYSQIRDQTQVFNTAGGFFTVWASTGKPKNTGVGSLFLLQGILATQQLSWDLLHCRQILYHLSHQGSP